MLKVATYPKGKVCNPHWVARPDPAVVHPETSAPDPHPNPLPPNLAA